MKPKKLSVAKNVMRRALADLMDPPPNQTEQRELRAHFADCCCYCGASAPPREGHLDHADPGGGNRLSNFLLACGRCNGDEKREAGWEDFLRAKCGLDAAVHGERRARIGAWLDRHRSEPRPSTPEIEAARAAAEKAIEAFGSAYAALRQAVREPPGTGLHLAPG
jgi:hypothetical protein